MTSARFISRFICAAAGFAAVLAHGPAHALGPIAAGDVWLDADFADLPPGPTGTGGAEAGQPVDVTDALDAIVVDAPFAPPALRLERNRPNGQASARFEFLDSVNAVDGALFVNFHVNMLSLDDLNIAIHRQGGGGDDFGVLRFKANGDIEFEHGGVTTLRTYSTGDTVRVSLAYDFEADLIEVDLDGAIEMRVDAAGIVGLANGVGAIVFRRPQGSTGPANIRAVRVTRVGYSHSLLGANFNELPQAPLEPGDPADGRPVAIDSNLVATVVGSPSVFETFARSLSYRRAVNNGLSSGAEFEFIDGVEITEGVISVMLRVVLPDDLGYTRFTMRERDSAANRFADVILRGGINGSIHFGTAGTAIDFIDTYGVGQRIDIGMEIDLDRATAAASIDGVLVVLPTPMALPDPLAAVGRLIVSQDHNSLAEAIVDDIHVRWYRDEPPESGDRIFNDDFEGEPN